MRFDNVTAALASNARRRPDHPALICGATVVTHLDLELQVQRVAGALMKEGLKRGELVGLSMRDTTEQIVVTFAMMRLGVILLPMDVRWTAAEKVKAMEMFDSRKLLTDSQGDDPPGVSSICIDERWMLAAQSAEAVTGWNTTEVSPLLLSLSSGTTGLPKGPLIDHGLFMRRMFYETVTSGTNQSDVNMLATPIYFGGGRNITLQNILIGATVVLFPPPYEIEDLVREVNARKVTTVFLVPTLLRRLLDLPHQDGLIFPNLRLLMCSGAMLHGDELSAIRKRVTPNIMNIYATTDGGIAAVLSPEDSEKRPGSVGKPAFLVDMQIVDEQHQKLGPPEIGRIRYQSLAVVDNYHRNPEETTQAFQDGWFYPGDLGYFDADGFLHIVGRSKDMIIRGGINIYPAEIEATLGKHPSVEDVAVVGWPVGDRGEEIAALVVPKTEVDEQVLIGYCQASLARYKIPRRIFFLSNMPRNDAGKVNKIKLTEMLPDTLEAPLRIARR